ncbi:hypothetical protein NC652_027798 [Populus alba x Populus x berolinensis]|nr:hypothetical protein NC652_027798 [Populus alba x Populus x berolinensis]
MEGDIGRSGNSSRRSKSSKKWKIWLFKSFLDLCGGSSNCENGVMNWVSSDFWVGDDKNETSC